MKIIVVEAADSKEKMGGAIAACLKKEGLWWLFSTYMVETTDISALEPFTLLLDVPADKVGAILKSCPETAFFMIVPHQPAENSADIDRLIANLNQDNYRDSYPNLDSYYILDGGAEEALNAAKACADTYLAHRNLCAVIEKINEIRPDTFTRTPGGEYVIFRHGPSEFQPVVEDPVPLELFASAILHSEEGLARLMSVWLSCTEYFRGEV